MLSKTYWSGRDFEKTTLDPPLGSGPYKIEAVDPGRSITYRRVADYWGADLPVNKGRYNVDVIRYDYYRDGTIALEAFKAGQYDIRQENSSKRWATGYDSPALRDGLIKMDEIPNEMPSRNAGPRLQSAPADLPGPAGARGARLMLFDFEWSNKNLFYGALQPHPQLFRQFRAGRDGRAAGRGIEDPREIPRPRSRTRCSPRSTTRPNTTARATSATVCARRSALLQAAGWSFKGEKLVNDKTGQPFEFEILLDDPSIERIVLPFVKNLERIGITVKVRTVDPAQYEQPHGDLRFRHGVVMFAQSLSPGNEQRDFFGSDAADQPGSRNILGIKSPVIDALIEELIIRPTARASSPIPARSTGCCSTAIT